MLRVGQRVKIIGNTCSAPDRITGQTGVVMRLRTSLVGVTVGAEKYPWWYSVDDLRPAGNYDNEEPIDP